jgi:hypothetical protein
MDSGSNLGDGYSSRSGRSSREDRTPHQEKARVSNQEYGVSKADKAPLLDFLLHALRESGCTPIHVPNADRAPFRLTFETPSGERVGIIAYMFLANSRPTKNRPDDEHRFQIKYGSDLSGYHEIWQDPFGLYTTLLFGINPERGIIVAADPVLNNPTRFSVSKEFKENDVLETVRTGWHTWERSHRPQGSKDASSDVTEVLLGLSPKNFLRFVLFEREALGEEQGNRELLAEQFGSDTAVLTTGSGTSGLPILASDHIHLLEREFELPSDEILDLIDKVPRLKMAVRGWVAEQHLIHQLSELPDVARCQRIEGDGQPDVLFQFTNRRPLRIECKNVLRKRTPDGIPRLDFMRSRESKTDPCGRFYSPQEFDVVAACLHPQTQAWAFRARATDGMAPHPRCPDKLSQKVIVGDDWSEDMLAVLRQAVT